MMLFMARTSFFGGTRVWTQGLTFARQVLLLLEPVCQPYHSIYEACFSPILKLFLIIRIISGLLEWFKWAPT
jgi:hypothetical protein